MPKFYVLRTSQSELGFKTRSLLYLFPIAPRIKDFNNADVAPQKRADLSNDAASVMLEADKAAIDAGDACFEQVSRQQTAGEADGPFAARLTAEHTIRGPLRVQIYRDEYAFMGRAV